MIACACLVRITQDDAYPGEVRAFFEAVGIDHRHFGDVWIPVNIGTELHYQGVFHFSGSTMVQGEDPVRIGSRFCMTFSTGDYAPGVVIHDLVRQRLPIAQIDLETLVPWLLDEPEPEMDELPAKFHCGDLRPTVIALRPSLWRRLAWALAGTLPRRRRRPYLTRSR